MAGRPGGPRCPERTRTLAVANGSGHRPLARAAGLLQGVPSSGALRDMMLLPNFWPALVLPLAPDDTRPRKLMVTAAWPYREWIG